MKKFFIFIIIMLILPVCAMAQTDRDYIRKGNRMMRDSNFVEAEKYYLKAVERNSNNVEAVYNLGKAYLLQHKGKEAYEQYEKASKMTDNKTKLAKIYHNMGVVLQSVRNLNLAADMYKKALRCNPNDDEARYNYILCKKQTKNQKKEEKKQQQQQKQEEKKVEKKQVQQEIQKSSMTKQNAKQMLNAVMQDEKNIQNKLQQKVQSNRRSLEKNW
ncbi:MAG: tetratricopeptide repeat protein [Bacteroidaceae bacterium]|nr:tetratricopeptide repeat protein [Bacteroidaceae bacterium]